MVRNASRPSALAIAVAGAILLTLAPASASAVPTTTINGPIGLGTAAPFAVLASSTVTNTGPSVIDGDIGLSPGSSITGLTPAVVDGTVHATDAVAAQAQADLSIAYGVAAGLTPTATGFGDLVGRSLVPGVYSGGELSLSGALTLSGDAQSVWVFQAASTLTIGSGAIITVTGGATACNVFWQVGSSATLNPGARFVGTVMADVSVTAETAATITGRLLARTGAVTLDTNTITAPAECTATPGTVTTSPTITSAAPGGGTVGVDYSHAVTSSGSPGATYSVTSGDLPAGLSLDAATGVIAGMPSSAGTSSFSITAANGAAPAATADYSLVIDAAASDAELEGTIEAQTAGVAAAQAAADASADARLAASGVDVAPALLVGGVLIALGGMLRLTSAARRPATRRTPARVSASR